MHQFYIIVCGRRKVTGKKQAKLKKNLKRNSKCSKNEFKMNYKQVNYYSAQIR